MITEDDWIRPLVLLRDIATRAGVALTGDEEQEICRQFTQALTTVMADEVAERRQQRGLSS